MSLKKWLTERYFPKNMRTDGMLSSWSSDVAKYLDIYNGGGDWRYTRKGGINGGTRRVASLGAAKAVCAELARLSFTEGTTLCSADSETEELIRRVLDENRFAERFPDFLEKLFALGSGMIKVYWDDGIRLDMMTADRFVPTRWDDNSISGAAFGSQLIRDGKSYYLAETRQLEGDTLTIENRLFDECGSIMKLSDIVEGVQEKSTVKGIDTPMFVCFTAAAGRYPECRPLGSSVLAGTEDTLKNLDIVFDSLGREFVLGKKRIIVPYYAVRGEYDENGDIRKYFDVNDEVYQAMSASDSDELKIIDNTAQLRISEHNEGISALLDLLCMQTGLSEGALSYKDGTIKTATEVVSRNSRTYRTQAFYRGLISEGLSRMARDICVMAKMSGQLSDSADEHVSVMFADGAAEDDSSRTDRAVKLYNAGLISRARALSQIYGVSLEEAVSMERMDFDE